MKKQILACAALALLLLSGCGKQQEVSIPPSEPVVREKTEDFIGAGDTELTEKKGEGAAQTYNKNGEQRVAQRKYDERLFDLNAEVEYFYGDHGTVTEIVAVFADAPRATIAANITKQLGEPKEKQEETAETQFRYTWEKDGKTYTLLDPANAQPAVIIQQAQN